MTVTTLATLVVFLVAAVIRSLPIFLTRKHAGVDRWYWKAYIDAVRRDGRIPPNLPNYLFDEGHWGPPLFPYLLALLPPRTFEKLDQWVAIAADMARLALLLVALKSLGLATSPWAIGVAGLLYATTPIASVYNYQLNPRGLGALLMDGCLVLMLIGVGALPPMAAWMLAALLCGLILLLHKMTTQLLVITLVGLSISLRRWELAALLPAGILVALILSGGYYVKVLRAHWDIVVFWTREWPLLGADPLLESPLYGRPNYQGPVRQFAPGLRNWFKRLASLGLGNYAPAVSGAILLALLLPWTDAGPRVLVVWLAWTFGFAVATVVIPVLRGVGFGNLYLYNAAFPAALVFAYGVHQASRITALFSLAFLALNVLLLARAFRYLTRQKELALHSEVLSFVEKAAPGTWMAFPMQLMEHIAYLANKPAISGGHGYGFKKLGRIFPVLRTDFKDLQREFGLRYILVQDSYRSDIERAQLPHRITFQAHGYTVFELEALTDRP